MENYRYFLKLAYNGSTFHGWQAQKNAHSVQQEIENSLYYILGNKKILLTGAGRTDTGVHARTYYAHFDDAVFLTKQELDQIVYRLNHILPDTIAIYDAFRVKPDVHARFSALSRTYHYYICRDYDPFAVGLTYRLTIPINIPLMKEASSMVMNYTDFTCFAKAGTQTSTNNCIIYASEWIEKDNFLIFKTKANRFLRNMVRAMTGTLLDIGKGKLTLEEFRKIIEEGTRSDAGQSVPACGLFLEDIEYPQDIRI